MKKVIVLIALLLAGCATQNDVAIQSAWIAGDKDHALAEKDRITAQTTALTALMRQPDLTKTEAVLLAVVLADKMAELTPTEYKLAAPKSTADVSMRLWDTVDNNLGMGIMGATVSWMAQFTNRTTNYGNMGDVHSSERTTTTTHTDTDTTTRDSYNTTGNTTNTE